MSPWTPRARVAHRSFCACLGGVSLCGILGFITPESQNTLAIVEGRSKRQGGGLLVEAGLGNSDRIIKIVGDCKVSSGNISAPWRVKAITCTTSESEFAQGRVERRKGMIAGSLADRVFVFYKGTWPSTTPQIPRTFFGGSTWGDVWRNVPVLAHHELARCPIDAKRLIFGDLWASQASATSRLIIMVGLIKS